jgi:hypothetical protein
VSELFTPELRRDLAAIQQPNSFLVSLCSRDEPPIQRFRSQIEEWFQSMNGAAQEALRPRLLATDNETLFQAFAEVVIHQSLVGNGFKVVRHPNPEDNFYALDSPEGRAVAVPVRSYVPGVQEQTGKRQLRELVDELSRIRHHYFFSVFLRSWLPSDFDPRPVRRALAMWLNSLDDGMWEGKYAEYRDGPVHIEFSILDKLQGERDHLVRFRIPPLDAPTSLDFLESQVNDTVLTVGGAVEEDTPVLLAVFSNNSWNIPTNFIEDWLLGKADTSFGWRTAGGRQERVKAFGKGKAQSIFQQSQNSLVSGVLLADKRWVRDEVRFDFRMLHNPWARNPIDVTLPAGWEVFEPIDERDGQTWLTWHCAAGPSPSR